jgi:hypothetical protein
MAYKRRRCGKRRNIMEVIGDLIVGRLGELFLIILQG